MKENTILTVSELTGTIKRVLENEFGDITVKGEISNLINHSSGHRYFTLKDDGAQIQCTLWKSRPVNFVLTNGMKAIVRGALSVYPPRGNYQIDVTRVTPEGQGDFYLAFEALKAKLSEAGYFDHDRKKALPEIVLSIGIITSPTGAVIQDMKTTINRRFPAATIYFRPAKVQGDDASADISSAIREMQKLPLDVIIVGRGGGSIEDLWPFNTEEVAKAIYSSKIPIVSAVGHETDTTIADFVADLRAPTPTAAAELVTTNTLADYNNYFSDLSRRMMDSMTSRIEAGKDDIFSFLNSYSVRKFINKIRQNQQFVDELDSSLQTTASRNIKSLNQNLSRIEAHLLSLNPDNPLKKGFAIVRNESGAIIGNNYQLKNTDKIVIQRYKQKVLSQILDNQYLG